VLPRVFIYIDAIARAGSIRKAAEQVHVAASALNRQLLDLEQELGVELFERLPRGMRATAAGELLLAHIRKQEREFELLRSQLDNLRGLRRGHIRITAHESATRELLPRAISAFRTEYPGVSFTVNMGTTARTFEELQNDTVELGLLFNPPSNALLTRLVEVKTPLYAVVASDHPLADRKSLRLSDCLAYPLALMNSSAAGGRNLIEALARQSGHVINPVLQTDSFELMGQFARQSGGIFFQLAVGVAAEVARGELVAIPLGDPILARGRLVLLARRGRTLSVPTLRFVHYLEEHMHALV